MNPDEGPPQRLLLLLETEDEAGLGQRLEGKEEPVKLRELAHEGARPFLLIEPASDRLRKALDKAQELESDGALRPLVGRGRLVGEKLEARGELARESLALLEVVQDAAQEEPHQKDVGRHNPREEGVERQKLPAERVNGELEANDHHHDGAGADRHAAHLPQSIKHDWVTPPNCEPALSLLDTVSSTYR